VAGTGKRQVRTLSWWERDSLEDLGIEGRIILRSIFKKKDGWSHSRFICLMIGEVVSYCEGGSELTGSKKCGEFLDHMTNC